MIALVHFLRMNSLISILPSTPSPKDILKQNKSVLRIVKEGKYFKDEAKYDFLEAKKLFSEGYTLLIRFAEKSNDPLAQMAQEFQKKFKNKVDIQLYCTPQGHNAFGWHYDVEEVFILQTVGSKEYTIRPNTVHLSPLIESIPKNLMYEEEKSSLVLKVLMKPGDFLYIPSGWWHKAETQTESMHISIGVMPSSAVRIAQALPAYLAQFPMWRTRMPLHQEFASEDEAINFYQIAFEKLGKDLTDKFTSREFIQYFLKQNS